MSDLLENPMFCANCGEPGCAARCPCKQVQYCSKECQVADWPSHKERCRARLEKRVRAAKEKHGKEHVAVAEARVKAGDAFIFEGRFAEAERYYLEARRIFTAAHGGDNPSVANVCLKLSRVYDRMCMSEEYKKEVSKASNLRLNIYLDKHINGADDLEGEFLFEKILHDFLSGAVESGYLTTCFKRLDDELLQAVKTNLKLAKRSAPAQGDDRMYFIHSFLGFQHKIRGEPGKALKMFQKALRITRLADKAVDERVADELINISDIFLEQERLVEARANYEEALGILRRLHGEKHPKVAYALKGIADILRRHDESDEALEVYKKVLNIQRRVYGKDHPQVAQTFRKIQDWNHVD